MADELGPLQPGLPSRTVGGGGGELKGGKRRKPPQPPVKKTPRERDGPPGSRGGIIDEYV